MSVLTVVRIGIPAVMVLLGLGLIVFGGDSAVAAGVVIAGCAALVWLASALVRFSIGEQVDRDREQSARDFYAEHGRWPDDPEPRDGPTEPAPAPAPAAQPHPGVQDIPAPDRTRRRAARRPPRR